MADEGQVNPKKIFVGNLPFSVTQDSLSELFSQYGEVVDVKLITDRMSGRSKGFGFVEYSTEDAANQAVAAMDGHDMEGRPLAVKIAKPMQPRDDRGPRGGGGGGFRGGDRRGGGGGGYGRSGGGGRSFGR